MMGRERLPSELAGQMRESAGSNAGHDREITGGANDHPFTKGRSSVAPPLTDHTTGRSPVPPPLTDHTQGRGPVLPQPPEGAPKASRTEPVPQPGQGPPAAD